jgi:response regulator RpfG family c-di-GMP phosphodiesterase
MQRDTSPNKPRILFIDDEPDMLESFKRSFRKQYEVHTAVGAVAGLMTASEKGPFAVAVADLRMPGIDGVEFLKRLKGLHPDTVRIVLTGFADIAAAIDAVNKGHVFRFLTKDSPHETLESALEEAVKLHQLTMSEKELLRGTLQGTIKLLTELLGMAQPEALGRAFRIKRLALNIAKYLRMNDVWRMELAVMLSQIGCFLLPAGLMEKIARGEQLAGEEQQAFARHPLIARDLLSHIPRLAQVADTVAYQQKGFDGSGFPENDVAGEDIPLGGRILKAALDYDAETAAGRSPDEAVARLEKRREQYDPQVFAALRDAVAVKEGMAIKHLSVAQLMPGMVFEQNVLGQDNYLLFPKGYEITPALILRLREVARQHPIQEPIRVLVPTREREQAGKEETAPPSQNLAQSPKAIAERLSRARKSVMDFNPLLREGRLKQAILSLCEGLEVFENVKLFRNERQELARLVENALYILNSDKPFRRIQPDGLGYQPGKESELRNKLLEIASSMIQED